MADQDFQFFHPPTPELNPGSKKSRPMHVCFIDMRCIVMYLCVQKTPLDIVGMSRLVVAIHNDVGGC